MIPPPTTTTRLRDGMVPEDGCEGVRSTAVKLLRTGSERGLDRPYDVLHCDIESDTDASVFPSNRVI
jgi:hypothetical protein